MKKLLANVTPTLSLYKEYLEWFSKHNVETSMSKPEETKDEVSMKDEEEEE